MPVDKRELLGFLELVDEQLDSKIRVNAVGGTAMTLLGLKASTIDIDFDFSEKDAKTFKAVLEGIPHGYQIDLYSQGYIFAQQLPPDYVDKCVPIKTKLENISLYSIHPLDIVASKLGRLNDRDMQDIEVCIKKHRLSKEGVRKRARQVELSVNRPGDYRANTKVVLGRFFGKC